MTRKLKARPRAEGGKGVARKLRQAGEVPAVAYGHHQKSQALVVNRHELDLLLAVINPENTLIDLEIEGGRTTPALIREVQHHPSRPVIFHVDFFQVRAGEALHVAVPVSIIGTPIGVRDQGGILQESLHELNVECFPRDIPSVIEVNVDDLALGESVVVSSISLPNVKILNDADLVICSVSAPSAAAMPEDAGVGGEVEPELVRDHRSDAEGAPSGHGSTQPE